MVNIIQSPKNTATHSWCRYQAPAQTPAINTAETSPHGPTLFFILFSLTLLLLGLQGRRMGLYLSSSPVCPSGVLVISSFGGLPSFHLSGRRLSSFRWSRGRPVSQEKLRRDFYLPLFVIIILGFVFTTVRHGNSG